MTESLIKILLCLAFGAIMPSCGYRLATKNRLSVQPVNSKATDEDTSLSEGAFVGKLLIL